MSRRRILPIRSTEAAECGIAALAMVANALGYRCTLAELRQRFSLSLKGATLSQLIDMAGQTGLQGRALRLDMDELGQLALPCILHWDLNHFVVLSRVDRDHAVVLDPARGERRRPPEAREAVKGAFSRQVAEVERERAQAGQGG